MTETYANVQIEVTTSTGAATQVCILVPERSVMRVMEKVFKCSIHIRGTYITNWVSGRWDMSLPNKSELKKLSFTFMTNIRKMPENVDPGIMGLTIICISISVAEWCWCWWIKPFICWILRPIDICLHLYYFLTLRCPSIIEILFMWKTSVHLSYLVNGIPTDARSHGTDLHLLLYCGLDTRVPFY